MGGYLEVWTAAGRELVALEGGRLTLGGDPANDLALSADPTLSRLHAVLERYGAGWCVRDLDSRNGTYVNGRRVLGERPCAPVTSCGSGRPGWSTEVRSRPAARAPRPASRRRS
jgi:pSer/pThr/pTyr-binding forkhead associated (FHA) protein